ncbi:response regulator transcription factor [Verticiella sediminum]|uniref:Response regulator transcription factor n=1 Tax=Verticiella sediminum TaxID=1247510 RepID=A0A556APM6_9BURK|nr:response regulator transcription factor [Verticiella sediminum]TSH94826.1 response regulator transcription factor [Verticiella sediminum]
MAVQSVRVLIVEDNVALSANIAEFLADKDFVLDFAADGLTALHLLARNTYDVIVMDVMLPGPSGFAVCRRVREDLACRTPIILMTAKDQLEDKERGFAGGADDYLVKPFHLRELEMRIDALYRRSRPAEAVLQRGAVSFEPGTLKLRVGADKEVQLSGMAAELIELLVRAHPAFVSHEELSHALWGERIVEPHTLRTHVYMLRKLLQDKVGDPLVKTVHGRGYRLDVPGEP